MSLIRKSLLPLLILTSLLVIGVLYSERNKRKKLEGVLAVNGSSCSLIVNLLENHKDIEANIECKNNLGDLMLFVAVEDVRSSEISGFMSAAKNKVPNLNLNSLQKKQVLEYIETIENEH